MNQSDELSVKERAKVYRREAYLRAKEKHNTWVAETKRIQKEENERERNEAVEAKDEALWAFIKPASSLEAKK